ncbi:unnamed protein product [Moneuplotes crassus]|uniref:Uncharacterized protein n=1 Tax=Euplotes crassus TaxID=5936 RepID=A0AAD1UKX8_EUPCR|nr:unnamed protein product [Moneuplotes crassus]
MDEYINSYKVQNSPLKEVNNTRRVPSERYGRLKQAGEGLINNSMQYPAYNKHNTSQEDKWRTDHSRLNSSYEFMVQVQKYNKLKNKLLVTKLQQQRNKRMNVLNKHRNIKNVLQSVSARNYQLKSKTEENKTRGSLKTGKGEKPLDRTNDVVNPQNAVPFVPTTQHYPYSFSQPMPEVHQNMIAPQDSMNNERMIEELMKKINEQRNKKPEDSQLLKRISSLEEENRNLERRSHKVQREMKALDQQKQSQAANPFGGYNPAQMGQNPYNMHPYGPGYPMSMPKRKKRRPSTSSSSSDSTNSIEEKEENLLKKKYYLRRLEAKLKARKEDKEIEERMRKEDLRKRESMDRIEEMKKKTEQDQNSLKNLAQAVINAPGKQEEKSEEPEAKNL